MSELLPCPFCGSSGGLDYFEGSTFRWRTGECECGASCGEVRHDTLATNQVEAENESRIKLHKAWNTRASQSDNTPIDPFRIAQILIERRREWLDIAPDSAIDPHADRLGMVLQEVMEASQKSR